MILNIKQFDVNRYGKHTKINRVVDRVAILKQHKAMLWLCRKYGFKVGLIGYLLQLLKKHLIYLVFSFACFRRYSVYISPSHIYRHQNEHPAQRVIRDDLRDIATGKCAHDDARHHAVKKPA